MDFYYGRMSGNSARAAFGLSEAGASFQPHLLDTRAGENRGAAYLAVNPMGKIPALVDGPLRLWESNAAGDTQAAEAGRKELARYLPVLEGALADRDWLEREFSLADIAYAPHLSLVAEGGFDLSPYPRVRAWLDRLLARPAWRKAAGTIFG